MIRFHQWEKFFTILTDLVYISVVHEFYSALKEINANKQMDVPWMRILVRRKEISILPPEIASDSLMLITKGVNGTIKLFLTTIKFSILEPSVEYHIGDKKQKIAINTNPHLGENALSDSKWIVWWMQEVEPIYEDYTRKNGLKLPQFPTAKYEVKVEPSKIKKEEELEDK
ncbi:hypothetical protein PVK06_001992 [Gossypium arboreum]|uniref:Uncharacterized protein n=1 Tax=Gossypium arboreum TaxID=29729 RepID=A0ABR0R2I2_GOSAR|nr:hypothetical protein PVK06_001992 [Gossypium arboreum]